MKTLPILAAIILSAWWFGTLILINPYGDRDKQLERFASTLPRGTLGTPDYWFEKHGIAGWNKVMLVFGYADPKPVCDWLVEQGAITNPEIDFRCTPSN